MAELKFITKEGVAAKRSLEGAHRISFAYTHKDQPKRSKCTKYVGNFSVPFKETVQRIFTADTRLSLFHNSNYGNFWRSIKFEDEFNRIQAWVKRQGTRHFLRDCLDLSVALDLNLTDNQSGQYTPLGALEARAKEQPDEDAINQLVAYYLEAITNLPFFRDAKCVAGVPPRPDKLYDLPSTLASQIAKQSDRQDLTNLFRYTGEKGTVKTLAVDKKWDAWEAAGLTFEPKLTGAPSIILLDDKYQSGTTFQFVASRLRAAGAGEIYGLCAVKTLRDTDNQSYGILP
ncbi:MAG: hypothetical protein HQL37_09285 [Alphaproteobacteria bacterium]|nr:hypothetical protein [Alphaproteobacteria bacterium]